MSDSEPTDVATWARPDDTSALRRSQADRSARIIELGKATKGGAQLPAQSRGQVASVVTFDRHELREIFGIYGRMVAEGEWRDYAIDFGRERAVFSIYRRSSEVPLYRIEKDPRLARRQGTYAVTASSGLILRRGHDLKRVIGVLEKPVKLVVT